MLSDHADGLHQGIADGGAHETKSWQKGVASTRRLQINRNVSTYMYYIYNINIKLYVDMYVHCLRIYRYNMYLYSECMLLRFLSSRRP